MPWLKVVHNCTLPTPEEVKLAEASVGSQWQCPNSDCNQIWELRGGDLLFGPRWNRVVAVAPPTGNGPVKDCVCCD